MSIGRWVSSGILPKKKRTGYEGDISDANLERETFSFSYAYGGQDTGHGTFAGELVSPGQYTGDWEEEYAGVKWKGRSSVQVVRAGEDVQFFGKWTGHRLDQSQTIDDGLWAGHYTRRATE